MTYHDCGWTKCHVQVNTSLVNWKMSQRRTCLAQSQIVKFGLFDGVWPWQFWFGNLALFRRFLDKFGLKDFSLALMNNFYGRDASKRQTAGIQFTHRPKIRFYAPQGRLVAPIHVKLRVADRHLGLLGCAKFHLNRRRGWDWECGPENIKKSFFWYRVASQERTLWPISKILRAFIRLTILH